MKKINRILAILLVVVLIIPGFTFAENHNGLSVSNESLLREAIEKLMLSQESEEVPVESDNGELFRDDDEVRIIVELKSKPSIVHATERNIGYQEMSRNLVTDIEKSIDSEQQKVKSNILANNIKMEFIHSFNTAFNGFSGKVKFKDIKFIENLPQVKKVYIANEYERPDIKPNMDTSNDMVGSGAAWELGYKGEGTVIAIIDTGIDPSHRDMVLSEGINPKLIREVVEEKDLLGRYFTEKVPYGYNYYDLNNEILDLGPDASMHGMHVAGTAGANGDTENGGIKGVAPEAQLLAMKVFSNDPIYATTFSDIYLVAIDEAIRLGADVLNMSLGSTASFYIPDSAEDVAITNATNNGIVCSVSAGNSGSMTYGWAGTNYGYPWKENPDIGVVGAPGLNKDTIQVASIENTHQKVNYITYVKDGVEKKVPIAIAGNLDPASILPGNQEYVDGGSGHPSELANVSGKVALIVRGGLTPNFTDKIQNAQDAGAVGVIVRNHQTGGEALVNMATPPVQTIPAAFIGYQGGLALMELEEKLVAFSEDTMSVPNPNANEMSDFTSWGTTPSLELKPEITAPGGQIYSTLQYNKYGVMSGTSMAAPHVAGGSSLVMEYIKEHDVYGNLGLAEQTRLAKVLLMNTANIIFDEYDTEYSPRRQGSGIMNLYGAVSTPVRVVDATTNLAKVELKDFEDTTFTMRFKAINVTNDDAIYDVDVSVLTDYIEDLGSVQLNLLSSDYIYDADIDAPETITVPANGEVEFEVTVDIGTDETIYWNMFVEGFVTLVDPDDNNATLSVPYVGFYGDWGEPAILDGMRFIDPSGTSYFNQAGMIYFNAKGDGYFYNSPHIYMNPGTEASEVTGKNNIVPRLSFMRNAEFVDYNILDRDGNLLRTIYSQQFRRKNYINGGRNAPVGFVWNAEWDGTVNGEILPDGDYFYEIKAKIHYAGAEVQSKKIPLTIDTIGPEVTNLEYNKETGILTWNAIDRGSGILGFIVLADGRVVQEEPVLNEDKITYELDLSEYVLPEIYDIQVHAIDNLSNVSSYMVAKDNYDPYIYIYNPGLFEVYDESEVLFEGYVTNYTYLDKVIVNDVEEAELRFIPYIELLHPDDPNTIIYSGPAYKFTATLNLEDGYQEIRVEAFSRSGDSGSLVRRFYVDTTAPELEIAVKERSEGSSAAELEITMRDALGYLRLLVGDSQIYEYDYPLAGAQPVEKSISYTVNLVEGNNTFIFTLFDIAGHETEVEVTIYRDNIVVPELPMEDLPSNSVIVGDEAFDIRYLNANSGAQLKLIDHYNSGETIYIKLNSSTIVDIRGNIVNLDNLPEVLTYYDAKGNTTVYKK